MHGEYISSAMDIVTRQQLSILIQLAEVDKHFSREEREKIYTIAKAKNFPKEDVDEIIQNPEPIGSYGALSDNQRFDYLFNCIELMLVDHKVFEQEILFCRNIAIKLGFRQDVVDFIVPKMNNTDRAALRSQIIAEYSQYTKR